MKKDEHPLYLDSDVVISAMLSKRGASWMLVKDAALNKLISEDSRREIAIVSTRLNIPSEEQSKVLDKINIHSINLKGDYEELVTDSNDRHIIESAKLLKTKFLLTYNLKDYKIDQIKSKLNIIVMSPGEYLQYLRS